MLHRRNLLAGIGGIALGTSFGGFAQSQSTGASRNIRVTHAVTSLAYLQSYVAEHKGFFAEAGLSSRLIDTGGGGPDVQLVLAGNAELTVNDGAQVLPALQQGQKLTCVLSLFDRSIVNVTMRKDVAERLKIGLGTPFEQKLAHLKGLKIGVTRAGALTWQLARFNLVAAKLDPDRDARVVAIGGPPALAAALDNGAIDVMYISMPIGEKLVQEGKAITLIDNARGEDPKLKNFMMEGLWATPDFITKNKEIVAAAVKAYAKASRFILDSKPEDIAGVVKPVLGSLGEAVLVEAIRRLQPAVSKTGRVSATELEATQAVLSMNGFLKKPFSLTDVFDAAFVA